MQGRMTSTKTVCVLLAALLSCNRSALQKRTSSTPAPELVAALGEMCDVVNRAMRDRSRPLEMRFADVQQTLQSGPHRGTLDDFFSSIPTGRTGDYEAIVAAAGARGFESWSCAGLQRMLELRREGDDDIDPALAATIETDLALICEIAEATRQADSADWSSTMSAELFSRLTNARLRWALAAIEPATGSERYRVFLDALAEVGVTNWSCAALEQAWSIERHDARE
jgi:hypothetical protein